MKGFFEFFSLFGAIIKDYPKLEGKLDFSLQHFLHLDIENKILDFPFTEIQTCKEMLFYSLGTNNISTKLEVLFMQIYRLFICSNIKFLAEKKREISFQKEEITDSVFFNEIIMNSLQEPSKKLIIYLEIIKFFKIENIDIHNIFKITANNKFLENYILKL